VSRLTKSPLSVARRALAVATGVLPPYAHVSSPRKYTQPQLFACLVLKTFLKTDYRGLAAHLADHSDLRAALGLKAVPHFTTPQMASRRLLRRPIARRLFAASVRQFLGRRRRVRRAAFDSTGLDCGHASRYYLHLIFRRPRRRPATCLFASVPGEVAQVAKRRVERTIHEAFKRQRMAEVVCAGFEQHPARDGQIVVVLLVLQGSRVASGRWPRQACFCPRAGSRGERPSARYRPSAP
jgi:hypothetical protein